MTKAYGGKKDPLDGGHAGEKSTRVYGPRRVASPETFDALRVFGVDQGARPPPVKIRSLNVAPAPELDLYQCVRPVRYFPASPRRQRPVQLIDMVIFRENTEDIYAGIEWQAESDGAKKVIKFPDREMGVKKIRFPEISASASNRYRRRHRAPTRAAIEVYAIDNDRKSVTIVQRAIS